MAYCLMGGIKQIAEAISQVQHALGVHAMTADDETNMTPLLPYRRPARRTTWYRNKKKIADNANDTRSRLALAKIFESNGDVDSALQVLKEGIASASPSDAQLLRQAKNEMEQSEKQHEDQSKPADEQNKKQKAHEHSEAFSGVSLHSLANLIGSSGASFIARRRVSDRTSNVPGRTGAVSDKNSSRQFRRAVSSPGGACAGIGTSYLLSSLSNRSSGAGRFRLGGPARKRGLKQFCRKE